MGKTTHSISRTPTYSSWQAMIHRCYDCKVISYRTYGAIGIRVCEFLRASPLNLASEIGNRPQDMTLDRENNSGNYSCGHCSECLEKNWPKNIRWATKTQQNRNQNDLHYITIEGQTKCASEWAELCGLSLRTILSRRRYGWTGKRILSKSRPNRFVTINGVSKTVSQWSKISGLGIETIRGRINRGFHSDELLIPVIPRKERRMWKRQ